MGSGNRLGDGAERFVILWVSLKSAWITGTGQLTEIWLSFKHGAISIWFEIENAIRTGIAGLVAEWKNFQNLLSSTGRGIGERIANVWERFRAGEELRVRRNRIQHELTAGRITPTSIFRRRNRRRVIFDT